MAERNPAWQRDELILALDLYFRHMPIHISKNHEEVKKLSDILNSISQHVEKPDEVRFRNPNGVYMKLCNFLKFDPSYSGKGLSQGGKMDEEIWHEFSGDRENLRKIAENIINGINVTERTEIPEDDEIEFPEGKILYRQHRRRERNRKLIDKAKQKAMKNGQISCIACGFDFKKIYGDLGAGYIECHHTIPVSEYGENGTTKIDDLALVCSNCHRMLHRKRPWLSINELKELIKTE